MPAAFGAHGRIHIANGQGSWCDSTEDPRLLVARGPLEHVVLEDSTEVTISILQKQPAIVTESAGEAVKFVVGRPSKLLLIGSRLQ